MQMLVTEKNKLQKQITNVEHESNVQREKLVSAHTEEKKMLLKVDLKICFFLLLYILLYWNLLNNIFIKYFQFNTHLLQEQHQLLSELENLKSRLNMLEQEGKDVTEIIVQKDALLSNLENEISTYK